MRKHDKTILEILSKTDIKSTHEILKELEVKTKKAINWYQLYRSLSELSTDNKAEKLKSKAGFFWRKK